MKPSVGFLLLEILVLVPLLSSKANALNRWERPEQGRGRYGKDTPYRRVGYGRPVPYQNGGYRMAAPYLNKAFASASAPYPRAPSYSYGRYGKKAPRLRRLPIQYGGYGNEGPYHRMLPSQNGGYGNEGPYQRMLPSQNGGYGNEGPYQRMLPSQNGGYANKGPDQYSGPEMAPLYLKEQGKALTYRQSPSDALTQQSCPKLSTPQGSSVVCSSTDYNRYKIISSCKGTCTNGQTFDGVGKNTLTLMCSGSQWFPYQAFPGCASSKVTSQFSNGPPVALPCRIQIKSNSEGSTFDCKVSFYKNPILQRVCNVQCNNPPSQTTHQCLKENEWNPPLPTCAEPEVQCSIPLPPSPGELGCSFVVYKAKKGTKGYMFCEGWCEQGYTFQGLGRANETLICYRGRFNPTQGFPPCTKNG